MDRHKVQEYIQRRFGEVGVPTKGGLVISEAEVAYVLSVTAAMNADTECNDPACPGCDIFNTWWWGLCNDLDYRTKIKMTRQLAEVGVPLPDGPWEEVPTNAVPTTRI